MALGAYANLELQVPGPPIISQSDGNMHLRSLIRKKNVRVSPIGIMVTLILVSCPCLITLKKKIRDKIGLIYWCKLSRSLDS